MKLFYFNADGGNFGDDLNAWIWDRLIPGWQAWDEDTTLVGVGTLLNNYNLGQFSGKRLLVLGSGAGYGTGNEKVLLDPLWDIRAVRGPWSASELGLQPELGVTDPATLLSDFDDLRPQAASSLPILVPHWETESYLDWSDICNAVEISHVSPAGEAKEVIRRIASAPVVLAESMHAAIIADTFRVPWIPIKLGRQFNSKKWNDFFLSVNYSAPIGDLFSDCEIFPKSIGPLSLRGLSARVSRMVSRSRVESRLRELKQKQPFLSDLPVLNRAKERYYSVVERTARSYGR